MGAIGGDRWFVLPAVINGDFRRFAVDNREDIAEVITTTERDDAGITYGVHVALRSMAAHAFEEGEDRLTVWQARVEFGQSDANVAGGSDFVMVARRQRQVADQISAGVWSK